ncbi:MAG: EAL domain-containing protein [Kofleriaceae bacterium]
MGDRSSPPLVLVVDDDDSTRWLARAALVGAGFAVIEASHGGEALTSQAVHRPDALLLDITMPVLDGYEVCRRIRQRPVGSVTPIMVMTVLDDVEAIETAYAAGATDFLVKPLNLALLPHRVRYMLRAAAAIAAARESARRLARAQRLARLAHWQLIGGQFEWSCDPSALFADPEQQPERAPAAVAPDGLLPLVHPEDRARVAMAISSQEAHRLDFRVLLPDGSVRLVHQEAEIDPLGPPGALFGATQDVTAMRLAEQRIVRLAYFDEETGLPNREFLRAFLAREVDAATPLAVISIELGVARVQDALATSARLLVGAALDRVQRQVREAVHDPARVRWERPGDDPRQWDGDALVARVGDDEAAVAVRLGVDEARGLAEQLTVALASSFTIQESEIVLAASVGLACYPDAVTAPADVARCARAAMVHSRELGRGSVALFDVALERSGRERLEISRLLHRSISSLRTTCASTEFELYYQPKIAPSTGGLTGVEALLRWRPSGGGPISPDRFIPIAEATGIIVPLGAWVLRAACEQGARWFRQGSQLRVAVNISARQLREPNFAAFVIATAEQAGYPTELLELEITERVTVHDFAHAVAVLRELRELGVRIALDDFGIGYSSLGYLSTLPIDTLKIDRSFILQVGNTPAAEAIPIAIIAMARSLGLHVVAEGVETVAQAEFLEREGAEELQGFLFARPMPAEELDRLLAQGGARWSQGHPSARGTGAWHATPD